MSPRNADCSREAGRLNIGNSTREGMLVGNCMFRGDADHTHLRAMRIRSSSVPNLGGLDANECECE